ncbi:MAG: hypothetical protein ACPGUC_04535, partial [Gammaproteobacteria bacterium]
MIRPSQFANPSSRQGHRSVGPMGMVPLSALILFTSIASGGDWRDMGPYEGRSYDRGTYDSGTELWNRSSDWRSAGSSDSRDRWQPYSPDPLVREFGVGEQWVPPDPRRRSDVYG